MEKTKIFALVLGLSTLFFTFVNADTNTAQSLYTLLNSQRTSVINHFDQTSNQIYNTYNSIGKPIVETVVYKSLFCLGVITQPFEKINIDIDRDILRSKILEEYIHFDGSIKRYELGLTSDSTGLQNDILAFSNKYNPQIDEFQTKQISSLSGLIQTVTDYTTQNTQLIGEISQKIIKIESAIDSYKSLNQNINSFQNGLSSSQIEFYDKLQSTKNVASQILDYNMQYLTDQFVRRYKKSPGLESYLLSQKELSLNIFNDYAQSQINEIFGVTYNQQRYTQISKSIQELKSQFYNGNNLNCINILGQYGDVTERKINNIISDINVVNSGLNISQVSIGTGLSASAQSSAIQAIKNIYTQHLNSSLQNFREFIYQKIIEIYNKHINTTQEIQ